MKVRYKCSVCGKITRGRLPVSMTNHKERGDGTFYYPRKHWVSGIVCPGTYQEAEWIEVSK